MAEQKKFKIPNLICLSSEGFKKDCDELLKRFLSKHTIVFEDFAEIWKEMKFILVFSGKKSLNLLIEWVEELLHISKQIFVCASHFDEKIFGLYLMYSLYYMQPFETFKCKIQMTYDDFKLFSQFLLDLKYQQIFDALFIALKMKKSGVFLYTLVAREHGIERSYRKHYDNSILYSQFHTPRYSNKTLQNFASGIVDAVEELDRDYKSLMKTLNIEKQINHVEDEFSKEMNECLINYKIKKEDMKRSIPLGDSEEDTEVSDLEENSKKKKFFL